MSATNSVGRREFSTAELRRCVGELLAWTGAPSPPAIQVVAEDLRPGYIERLVEYSNSEGEPIRAFMLVPDIPGPLPGVVVHHQHHGQRHLGKSEVVGHAGDPIQAFGPRLARNGIVVLAPDAICFEDRRRGAEGTLPEPNDDQQHYDEMAYRLVTGRLLMSVVIADAALAVSALVAEPIVDSEQIGVLGHSMGGHTTLFSAALDERVSFAGISGALCGYRARIERGVGVEFAQVVPGILELTDFDGLLALIAPRPALILSAEDDPYSFDAPNVVERVRVEYTRQGTSTRLTHHHYSGGHPLTEERVSALLDWTGDVTSSSYSSAT